jgi:bacterioferritin-associated ferredoxin
VRAWFSFGEAKKRERNESMIVCHCKGLSEREIKRALIEGASSADEVARSCLAGSECGGCRPLIEKLVRARRTSDTDSSRTVRS